MAATRWLLVAGLVGATLVVGAGAFVAGRVSADAGAARRAGYAQGHRTGYLDGYVDGLLPGEAQGRREGRVEQETAGLPADAAGRVRVAFEDGYAAGANDVFAGYDGGWSFGTRYVITVAPGRDGVTYRIASRVRAP